MQVYFIRHGESASNAATSIALPHHEGDRLTELGWAQSRAVAPLLEGIGATRLLCSPQHRAMETAHAISESTGLAAETMEDIHEYRESDDYGELSEEDQRRLRWSNWMSEHGDDPGYAFEGAESFNEVLARVARVKQELLGMPDQRVLAVTHGIFLRFFFIDTLLGEAFGAPQARRLWQLGSVNCGICAFEYSEPDDIPGPEPERWRCLAWMAQSWAPR